MLLALPLIQLHSVARSLNELPEVLSLKYLRKTWLELLQDLLQATVLLPVPDRQLPDRTIKLHLSLQVVKICPTNPNYQLHRASNVWGRLLNMLARRVQPPQQDLKPDQTPSPSLLQLPRVANRVVPLRHCSSHDDPAFHMPLNGGRHSLPTGKVSPATGFGNLSSTMKTWNGILSASNWLARSLTCPLQVPICSML
jgi:hypothetical protein